MIGVKVIRLPRKRDINSIYDDERIADSLTEEYCGNRVVPGRWACSRPIVHDGRHIAYASTTTAISIWNDAEQNWHDVRLDFRRAKKARI